MNSKFTRRSLGEERIRLWPAGIVTVCLAIIAVIFIPESSAPDESRDRESKYLRPEMQRVAGQEDKGEAIFRTHCARCHGDNNQGVTGEFEHSIAGPLTLDEMASYIEQTMPADNPELVAGADAKAVASFVLDHFLAEESRGGEARVELLRLTNRQLENSIADVFEMYMGKTGISPDKTGGLKAEYRPTHQHWKGSPEIEKVDSIIELDYGEGSPFDNLNPEEGFSVVWKGAVFAPESGRYTFVVESPNGVVLHVNDDSVPLIDGTVSTPESPRRTAEIKLLGGRWYPIRLLFFRRTEATSSLRLAWKMPDRLEQAIPQRYLSPEWAQPLLVVNTLFPPDDRNMGYERGTLVSNEWVAATHDTAVEVADWVERNFRRILGVEPDSLQASARAARFCREVAMKAWSVADDHPALDELLLLDNSENPIVHDLRQNVIRIFQSPLFLYPELPVDRSLSALRAARLGRFTQQGIADSWVAGELSGADIGDHENTLRWMARELLNQPAGKVMLRNFFVQRMMVAEAQQLSKDPGEFPGFDAELIDDLQQSLLLFLDDQLERKTPDYRNLFTSDEIWVNRRIADYYSADIDREVSESADFSRVRVDSANRAGLLTHPLLLSQLAYFRTTSPIHRGVFLARDVIGLPLKPPPVAVEPLGQEFNPEMTTRQRVEFQTSPDNCMTCHRVINPLGFALERLDAVGRLREKDGDKEIDDSVSVALASGSADEIRGPRELAEYLVAQRGTHRYLVESLFHHMVQQPIAAWGPNRLDELTDWFITNECNVRELAVEIAVLAAMGTDLENGSSAGRALESGK